MTKKDKPPKPLPDVLPWEKREHQNKQSRLRTLAIFGLVCLLFGLIIGWNIGIAGKPSTLTGTISTGGSQCGTPQRCVDPPPPSSNSSTPTVVSISYVTGKVTTSNPNVGHAVSITFSNEKAGTLSSRVDPYDSNPPSAFFVYLPVGVEFQVIVQTTAPVGSYNATPLFWTCPNQAVTTENFVYG